MRLFSFKSTLKIFAKGFFKTETKTIFQGASPLFSANQPVDAENRDSRLEGSSGFYPRPMLRG